MGALDTIRPGESEDTIKEDSAGVSDYCEWKSRVDALVGFTYIKGSEHERREFGSWEMFLCT